MPCTPAGRQARRTPVALVVVVLAMVATACGGGPGTVATPGPGTSVPPPTPTPADLVAPPVTTAPAPVFTVAAAEVPEVAVYAEPTAPAAPAAPPPTHRLANPRPLGSQLVFLVREQRADWLRVMLPVRPNGTEGWVRASDVSLAVTDYRVVVDVGDFLLTVFKGHEVFHTERVALGRGTAPTPGGRFYLLELFEVDRSQPYYGPFAYGLSGYSEVLYDFAGGDGQFGIHGTDDPASLGRAASNGCIRMSNEGITKLAAVLPLGVPVEIRA